jgi:nucleotide-binding universal stress UspA family protein
MYKRILLTDDGSPLSRGAVPHAVQFATTAQAGVLVLRVSHAAGEDRHAITPDSWPARVHPDGAGERPEGPVEADPPLTDVTGMLTDAGIGAVGALVVKDDDPGDAIVDVAARLGCDLIVMSSHGLSGIRRTVLGSVADHVVRHARAPVLLCQ